ncbi:hypothetical protein [Streptomyces sp. NBC_01565]|uniref:DUF4190 domain-containing protein n=1 Tax=unclassified Streptomyces TaxID=2593676 RepID=UPI00224F861C|nr:hypothetical protein [Streptomyces sp. NBC_01565]MCX4540992.1 hypothetical protein [Streptomyces sp. NBC_01565]
MTDHSPEPRDPWAPPERPAVDPVKQQGTPGVSGAPSGPSTPSVHDQPTIAGMPGAEFPQASAPSPATHPMPIPGASPVTPPGSPAYGYPSQPAPGGYGYPVQPQAPAAYGYPGYPGSTGYPAAYPGAQPNNGFGVTSLVLGILSVVGCVTSIFAVALGIAAVVFGALGRGKANRGEATNGGMALAGLILGAVGIVLGGLLLAIMGVGLLADLGELDDDSGYDSPYSNSQNHQRV